MADKVLSKLQNAVDTYMDDISIAILPAVRRKLRTIQSLIDERELELNPFKKLLLTSRLRISVASFVALLIDEDVLVAVQDDFVQGYFTKQYFRKDSISDTILEEIQDISDAEFSILRDTISAELKKVAQNAMSVALTGGELTASLLVPIQLMLDKYRQSLTTRLINLQNAVEVRVAFEKEEDPEFEYIGPSDGKIRAFCKGLVGKKLKLSEINKLKNGIDDSPVIIYGGGPNCRHYWRAV